MTAETDFARMSRESPELWNLIDTIPVLVLCAQPDGFAEFANRAWREYAGRSLEQLTGWGWRTVLHPDEVTEFIDRWNASLTSENLFETEVRMQRADGKYKWFSIRRAPAVSRAQSSESSLRTLIVFEDINERKELQILSEQERAGSELDQRVAEKTRELAEANEELQLQVGLLQHLPVSAWTLKPDGTPDFVNQVWLDFSGQTLDFVRSHPEAWMTAVHPEDREAASRAFWEGVRSGQGFAIRNPVSPRPGRDLSLASPATVVLRDAEGKVLKFVGTTTDIDDQKRAEEKLRESEHESRLIVNSIPAQISVVSASGEMERANQSVLDYYGRSLEDFREWATDGTIHPDDRDWYVEVVRQTLTSGDPFEHEVRTRRFDGVYRWFEVRGRPLRDHQGQILRWYFLQTDIDDRKRAEEDLKSNGERHRVVVETAPDAVISMNDRGTIQFANPATARIFGYDPTELIGRPLTVLMPQYLRERHENGFKRYLATGKRHLNWQGSKLPAHATNGQEFPVEISFGEMTSDGHKVFTGFIRDISERKQAEDNLRVERTQPA